MTAFDEQQNSVNGKAAPTVFSTPPVPFGGGKSGIGGFNSFLSIMRRRIAVAAIALVAILGLTALYTFTRQPLYQSQTLIDLNPNGTSGSGLSDVLQQRLGYDELNSQVATQVEILRGEDLALDVCTRLKLLQNPAFTATLNAPVTHPCDQLTPHERVLVLSSIQHIVTVDSVSGTNLVRIRATSPDRALSKAIANDTVSAFIASNLRAGVAGTDEVSHWLDGQMLNLSETVNSTQKDLAAYQRDKNIVGAENGQGAIQELSLIQSQLAQAAADRIQKEALLRIAQSSSPELLGSVAEGSGIQALRSQKIQLQGAYDQLTTKFGPGYPRVKELAQQIAAEQTELDREIDNTRRKIQSDYAASVQVEDALNARYKQKQQEAFQLNDSAARYSILRQNAESARDLYNAIEYKLRESGIEETLKSAKIRVIEPAVLADRPVYPRKGRMLLYGLLLSLFSACGIAYLLNFLDDSFHLPEVVEPLTGLPVLVTVPHIEGLSVAGAPRSGLSPRLVSVLQPMSLPTEAFRALRSSVLLSRADGSIAVQLVTSGSQSEGKSMTASNYAVTLAQQGHRVLLVDADLRRGTIHNYFGVARSPGLSQLLSSQQRTADIVSHVADVQGLDLLPIGVVPPNPSELLNSHRFDDLLREWRQSYDFIIIDSAPLLPVADSYGIASKADLVVLVVRIEQTRTRSLQRTAEILARLKASVVGVVVNDTTARSAGYRYHYYGDYKYAEEKDRA